MSSRGVLAWLTLSERQAVTRFKAAAEQNEGLRGGRVGKVDHLHAAFQGQLVAQVEQMLLLHRDTGLRRHLFKECRHPERIETQKPNHRLHHVAPIRNRTDVFPQNGAPDIRLAASPATPKPTSCLWRRPHSWGNVLLFQFILITLSETDYLDVLCAIK